MVLETKNLYIKSTVFDDLEYFYEMERLPEVTEFFSIEKNQSKEMLYKKYFSDSADEGAEQFTIFLKGKSEPIGRIVLADIVEGWKAEIWRIYIADTALRGKGYGKEALLAIMEYCFSKLHLQRIYLDFYTGNPAEFLYKKVGFKEEGVLRNNCRKNGVLYDVHLMSMLKEEYRYK